MTQNIEKKKMQKSRKRKKHIRPQTSPEKPIDSTSPAKSTTIKDGGVDKQPYPHYPRPSPEECEAVRDDLLDFHGFPQEFAKYREQRQRRDRGVSVSSPTLESGLKIGPFSVGDDTESSDHSEEGVLDGLVSTILSQNTTETNSQRAFSSLKSAFPTWEAVLAADSKCIENAIRCGGLAPTKASCIKNMLSCLLERRGKLCLEYLRELSVDEVKLELSQFKGIGPKTVACVLMFQLQLDDFPVDTHVFQIAKSIGWLPAAADMKKTYLHLNHRIPKELKFDLNCLLYTHGKLCQKCSKRGGGSSQKKDKPDESCPLQKYCKNN